MIGLITGLVYFSTNPVTIEDHYPFFGISIPMAITGFIVMIYGGAYMSYTTVIDKFLEELVSGKRQFNKDKLQILTAPNVTENYNASQFRRMLIDLRNHRIIGFAETEEEYIVQLSEYAESKLDIPKVQFSWQCSHCGAANTSLNECEYCNTTRLK